MSDVVEPVDPYDALISILIEGTDVGANLGTVQDDATGRLVESVNFIQKTASHVHSDANWKTHFTVHCGIEIPASGNWRIYLMPTYGSPSDTQSPLGKNRPYYSRSVIPVTIGTSTLNIDSVGAAEVIGNGQTIPPTVLEYDPNTGEVVSTLFAGASYAFTETIRVVRNHNKTGFSDDGEFTVRYDHTIDNEGRDVFYPAAGWSCAWVASTGKFLRGDLPGRGQPRNGFCCGESGPYARPKDGQDSPIYPIEHIIKNSRNDQKVWGNTWRTMQRETRGTSGIGPFCLNILSRGSSLLRDFGYAWLLKRSAAMMLQQWPSPVNPHINNRYLHNYDTTAMRGKGRVPEALILLARALGELAEVRNAALDPEVGELRLECIQRFVDIVALLKQDFRNNSWLEETDNSGNGQSYSSWMAGHYFQGLINWQESIEALGLPADPDIHDMMVEISTWIHDHTYLWTNNGPHPLASSVTYTGGENGYYLCYYEELEKPELSEPTTGLSDKMIIAYEWAKANGIRNGAKQDAIIAQYSGVNYKWKLGATGPKTLYGQFRFSGAGTLTLPEPSATRGGKMSLSGVGTLTMNPTISGGGSAIRTGDPIAVTSRSVGDSIAVGPNINNPNTKTFEVIRLDDYRQGFTVSLSGGRTLDGTERWRSGVRREAGGDLLMSFDSDLGTIARDGSNNPILVFTPGGYETLVASEDDEYLYDLEMSKGGQIETYSIDKVNILTVRRAAGAAAFTVVRGDDYLQPFTVTLDNSRTLDGTERWTAEVFATATGQPVMSFSSGNGTIQVETSGARQYQPSMLFRASDFGGFPIGDDASYHYKLRMEKAGKIETSALDHLTVRTDLSR